LNTRTLKKSVLLASAAGVTVVALAACASSSTPTDEASPDVTASSSANAPSGTSTSGTATSGTGQEVLAPVSFNKTVTYPSGLTTQVVKSGRVTVAAQGPGEVSGPGVSFTIKLTNKAGDAIDLDSVAVNAFYGKGKTPTSPAPTAATPFSGSLGSGASTEATFVFGLPAGANPVELQFSYAANAPIAVFAGKV
jgi:ABC-type oligopeptide transport system substrate-binding subunit